MGNEIARDNGIPARPPVPSPKAPERTGGKPGGDGNSAPGNSATRTPGTGKPGNPAGGGTGKAEKEKLSGLAPISDTVPTPATPQKKTRKAPAKKTKQTPASFNAEQISALFISASTIIASRPGCEMFLLSKTEADQLATPLANMIAKSEKLSKASEHADAIALVTAAIIIFIPRLMMFADQNKKKKAAKEAPKLVRKEEKNSGNDGKSTGKSANHAETHGDSVLAAIPSLV